ncbi:MAG: Nif3-like dinuclear metal center hexameric protein [Thermoguttaceae bacterium]|nr:Nif3-like dinuclear metal center hexameric protein [Thermoguttaceae bacterium]MDW8079239.1 Nif3-like dinuclear metal center hexameric protein [Thermoguttaceae bacterium]
MVTVSDVVAFMQEVAPLEYAAKDDNVGLLLGDPAGEVARVMTALTLSPDVAEEAVEAGVDLVVVHHPFPYRPVMRVITADPVGRLIWRLAGARIAVYSPHTAWDSARGGINDQWAEALGLSNVRPLAELRPDGISAGRWGWLPQTCTLSELVERVKAFVSAQQVGLVGEPDRMVQKVGVACGSGAELLPAAIEAGCEVLISGEMNYHRCLQCKSAGLGLILVGHFASERFAMEHLAKMIARRFPQLKVWASTVEKDPIVWC